MRKALVLISLLALVGLHSVPAAAQSCPNALPQRLSVGRRAHVTPGAANNLRQQPGKNSQIVTQVAGDTFIDIIGGPQCADNLLWWQVFTLDGQIGWMAEGIGTTYILEPTTTSTAQFTVPADGKTVDVQFGNIAFTYNGVFGKSIQAAMLLPVLPDPNNPLLTTAPASTNFIALPDEALPYPYEGVSLSVYPVGDYENSNDFAKTNIPKLAAILSSQPPKFADDQSPQALPSRNAGQEILTNVKYLSFDQGSGLRFITVFVLDAAPITNQGLVYVYQGLSADQRYLVTTYVPLKSTALPAAYDQGNSMPDLSSPNAGDLFTKYIATVEDILNKAPDTAFTPSLDQIDAVMQSIKVR